MPGLLGARGGCKKRLRRAKELADLGAVDRETLASLETKYGEKPDSGREANDLAIRMNCMLAGEHYVLTAAELGLGCCWVAFFDPAKIMEALQLEPKYNFPIAILPTGYPAGPHPAPRPRYGIADIAWMDEPGRPWTAEAEEVGEVR